MPTPAHADDSPKTDSGDIGVRFCEAMALLRDIEKTAHRARFELLAVLQLLVSRFPANGVGK